MKTFLKILLAAIFLLQISMANEGTPDTKQNQGTTEHQDSDNKTSKYKEDEGRSLDNESQESNEPPDNAIYPDDIVPCNTLSTNKTEVQEEIVNIFNEIRSNVTPSAANMLRMKWSNKLMESAQRWAETCNLNHSQVKDRNDNGVPYGENVLVSPACVKWSMAIEQWYNERENLIWGIGPIGDNVTGHYTQMVTCYTFEMGCAVKKCKINGTIHAFFVCQFYPCGNRPSSLYDPYSIGEPCSLCSTDCDESGKLCLNSCSHVDEAKNCWAATSAEQCGKFEGVCKAACLCKNKIT